MDKVVNTSGYVAVQHYNANGWTVKIESDNITYTFVPRHNLSLAWIKEEHLGKVLSIRRKGCCGTNPQRFHLASQINVNLWNTGNRHGIQGE